MLWPDTLYCVIECAFIAYFVLYNSINLFFVAIAIFEVRRRISGIGFEDLDLAMKSPFTPPISIIVPAFNEEKTIIESLHSVLNIEFPRIEVVLVNDGSTDNTMSVLKKQFNLSRFDRNYPERITTARVRACFECKSELPKHVQKFLVIDKENGGKADALNAGINASRCPYFVSVDADSMLDGKALLQAFRMVLDHEDIVAIGGQVAIVNGSVVEGGTVVETGMPRSHLVRFQVVEYIRSFAMSRSALSKLESLAIISGVFGIFDREFVQKVGGYLTKHLTSKVAREHTGTSAETVCEDMEIIVRMQRYIKEKKLKKRIAYVPHPLSWTEAPEDMGSLGKQRNRWQRGLMESIFYHRKLLFNSSYGRIGLFCLPYFFVFELLGAPVELLGYLTLPALFALDGFNYFYMLSFLLVSVLYGILLSVSCVIVSAWRGKTAETDIVGRSLVYYNGLKEVALITSYGLLEYLGYRQLTIYWRTRGIVDYLKGKRNWDKFERKGFVRQT